jgi:predicted aldo/keto reductase-like oxidoreductase
LDRSQTERQLLAAIDGGVNYFDTAYIYGNSEATLGEILERNGLRNRVRIATKLPHYLIRSAESLEKLFQEQLRRLRTDHIDYYLMHMLTDLSAWEKLKALGIEKWIEEKKASGAIGQIGYSYHGGTEGFCRLLDAYDWDFCQIQYNYMDEYSQAGRYGLNYAYEKGIPVVIMEPLRGGRLANLPAPAKKIIDEYDVLKTPAKWAFQWLFDQKEVFCVLSGMNSDAMVEENVRTASETEIGSLTEEDRTMLKRLAEAVNAGMKVGCTGCRYCMPCPHHVDIPGSFSAYNRLASEGRFSALKDYFMCTALRKEPTAASNCVGCGACEKHCPQGIEIRKELQNVRRSLEGPLYRIGSWAVHIVHPFG